jgi:NAD(P)-dependent dehydrogenase (short-subunit alcohol dehydrogenase family)
MSNWNETDVVFITGAGSGIGRATAIRFSREGASVACLDRNQQGLEETAGRIGAPERTKLFDVDLVDEAAVEAAVDEAAAWKEKLAAVVNVAGISPAEDFLESDREFWDTLMNINLRGSFLVARRGAHHMKQSGGGAIVNVSSILALVADPSLVSYGATKGAVSSMTRAMAISLAPDNIRVNAVCPGDVASPLLEDWIEEQDDPAAMRKTIAGSYPLGHYCEPADVAGVIFFLAGPDARCITGENVVVDCGLTVKCY